MTYIQGVPKKKAGSLVRLSFTRFFSFKYPVSVGRSVGASLPPSPKTQTVSEPVKMAVAMGAVTRPPEPAPSELKPMSALSQLCQSVTPTMVGHSYNAEMSRSSQKPPSELKPMSALSQLCGSVTPMLYDFHSGRRKIQDGGHYSSYDPPH